MKAWRLENLELTGADCFVLDMLAANVPHHIMDAVFTMFDLPLGLLLIVPNTRIVIATVLTRKC